MRFRIAAAAVAAFALAAAAPAPASQPRIVVRDGVTQPVFGYADAIRERVWIQSDWDSDADGVADRIAADIMRPRATEDGLKVPVIMDASPYYSTLGRGNESELKADVDGDGLLDRWPLFYDNYFVPRGYAVILLDTTGTNNSTGCPTIHDDEDNLSGKLAIDWLNGRARAYDAQGEPVVVDWHNGRAGMIGKSYDGTLANAVAATGVKGLTTIVPISAISSYYDYTRSNGVIQRGNNYLASLATAITDPQDLDHCAPVRDLLSANDGDETGDYSPFWLPRDYNKDVDRVRASVFVIHGINDGNVRPDHASKWWYGLAANGVPRKIWWAQEGHVDPFDFRRAHWVRTIHRWFDYWLQRVPNGIMWEPMADIERAADQWETHRDWPVPGARSTDLFLRADGDGSGSLALWRGWGRWPQPAFVDDPAQNETTMVTEPEATKPSRLAFLSQPLRRRLHFSGTPVVELQATVDREDTNLGAILVDYGSAERVDHRRSGEGIRTLTTEDCWGEESPSDNPCYRQTEKRVVTEPHEVVTKGILDALNRNSLTTPQPLVPGREYRFRFRLLPEDYVFEAGHRIGVIVVGSYRSYGSQPDETRATITLTSKSSRLELPVVGGRWAALASGGFEGGR